MRVSGDEKNRRIFLFLVKKMFVERCGWQFMGVEEGEERSEG